MGRKLSRVFALLFWLLIPIAHIHAQTQAAMNAQARSDFARADAELNKTYQEVLAKLPTVETQKLKEAQRAWIASRDAEAARAAKEAEGGSMAPTLRYETMTDLTRKRVTELKAMIDNGTASSSKRPSNISKPSPTAIPESQPKKTQSASQTQSTPWFSLLGPSSISPDKKWEYKCAEYGLDQCAPEIVKTGTTQVVLDLDEELQVHGPEARQAEVIWAPDSKRFAFNYSPPHAHHTSYETVAFYQLRGDKWEALRSPVDDTSDRKQLAQLGKGHLPKDSNPRRCAPDSDVLKVRNWVDANTAILYAPCYGRASGELDTAFLFTLKFDAEGKWKIVKTHQLSKKELEDEQ